MRFAEMVFRSLPRRISSIMAEYDASTSVGSGSGVQVSISLEYTRSTWETLLPAISTIFLGTPPNWGRQKEWRKNAGTCSAAQDSDAVGQGDCGGSCSSLVLATGNYGPGRW